MSRQKVFQQFHRPSFYSLGHQCVIRIGAGSFAWFPRQRSILNLRYRPSRRINSATVNAGCVSFNWMATWTTDIDRSDRSTSSRGSSMYFVRERTEIIAEWLRLHRISNVCNDEWYPTVSRRQENILVSIEVLCLACTRTRIRRWADEMWRKDERYHSDTGHEWRFRLNFVRWRRSDNHHRWLKRPKCERRVNGENPTNRIENWIFVALWRSTSEGC